MARVQILNPNIIIDVHTEDYDDGKIFFLGEIIKAKDPAWKECIGMNFDSGKLTKKEYKRI